MSALPRSPPLRVTTAALRAGPARRAGRRPTTAPAPRRCPARTAGRSAPPASLCRRDGRRCREPRGSLRSARKRSGPMRRQRPTISAARCVTARAAGPTGIVVGWPNIVTGWPSPARSRSPMIPTSPPSRSRRTSARPASRSGTRSTLPGASVCRQELEERARLDLLDRRQRAQPVRGDEGAERLEVAEVAADQHGRATAQEGQEPLPVGDLHDLVDPVVGVVRGAQQLDVVARVVAEGGVHECSGTPARASAARSRRTRAPGWRPPASGAPARGDTRRRPPESARA